MADVHLWNGRKDPYLYCCEAKITENGEIISSWEFTGNGNECKFSFTIPKGSHATLYLDNEEYEFESGTHNAVFEYEGV